MTFRFPARTRAALQRSKKEERRSLSSLMVLVLEDWLATRGSPATPKASDKKQPRGDAWQCAQATRSVVGQVEGRRREVAVHEANGAHEGRREAAGP